MNQDTITPPPHQPHPAISEQAVAPSGSVCRACLHGIRGLPVDGNCTECNAPIARSLDRAWWGNAPIGYLQDLRPVTRHALIAAAVVPIIWLISRFLTPATVATVAQNDAARIAISIVSGVAAVASTLLIARFLFKASLLSAARDRRLVIAAWVSVVAVTISLLTILASFLIAPMRVPAVYMWLSLAQLVATPIAVMAVGRAFFAAAPHIGGVMLQRLAIVHVVSGVLLLLVSIPLIAFYASMLQGSFGMNSWWMPMLSWLPGVFKWVSLLPAVTPPLLLAVFAPALSRIVEARRAGT